MPFSAFAHKSEIDKHDITSFLFHCNKKHSARTHRDGPQLRDFSFYHICTSDVYRDSCSIGLWKTKCCNFYCNLHWISYSFGKKHRAAFRKVLTRNELLISLSQISSVGRWTQSDESLSFVDPWNIYSIMYLLIFLSESS